MGKLKPVRGAVFAGADLRLHGAAGGVAGGGPGAGPAPHLPHHAAPAAAPHRSTTATAHRHHRAAAAAARHHHRSDTAAAAAGHPAPQSKVRGRGSCHARTWVSDTLNWGLVH